MKFKKIKVTGFKSFVDPTEITIEEGLTGIVGPNGCGKSNVVESLRWCMGETSPKSMRSTGMEDVIFSGTSDRPARNNAEVTISLDNKDRTAPAEFNEEEEIQIKRKIEKDRGSEYRINGKEVRARDVQRLFADLSTGAHSPSLISQGRVGALINAKPIDRRAVLEEAAGISGLHSRRHEAELKLKAAETNLQRLKDIMRQLNSQITNLKKQAQQAETYKTISSEINRLEGVVMYLKWYNLKESFEKSNENLQSSESEIRKYTLEVTQATTSQAKANEKIQPLREKEIEAAAKLNRINLERESLDHEEERIKEAKNNLERTIQQIIGDFEREQFQLKDASKDLEILNAKKNHTDNDQGIHEVDNEKIDSLKEEKDQLEVQIADLEKNIEQYNTIKNSKRDDWQRTIVSNENIMSKQSTLKEVEGYDDTSNWTKIFTDKFYASLSEISQKVSEAEEISNKAKTAYEKASNDAKDAATLSLELREKLRQKDIEQKYSDWTYEFQRLNKSIKSANEHIEELTLRKKKSEEELKKISSRPEEIAQRRGQLIETKGFAETERQFAADRLAEADNELKKIEGSLRSAQNDLANIRESKGRTEATKELAESRLKELDEESQEKFYCKPQNIIQKLEITDDLEAMRFNMDRNEAKLDRLKQQRETMGAVNLRADLETKEIDDELETMSTEKNELDAAIKKMRESIEELNKEGRARLLKAFDTVNNHFKDVFVKLFNGGKAHLELVDADDPLDAGLEMMVSPPGKKLQSMSLLSGGEQALTAMSLIFAIFLTNPSPICVLDEVDAPLDDANVERFCNLLDDISAKTQTKFMIITHHALTMSRMDRLFGVTMAERGVSQIVSVDLKRAEEIGAVA
ncbi:MAG: chromosome segregation SMC family protein [Candidatus Pelagibacterales bacterium]|jgi:chromosome segregation protein|nr:AAA family ATPase [Pelagibacterales bacterium]|tara:strand:- start:4277 stop:6871 length:2595 start_codon:yes stop_codon:yes gene_type:complete